MTDELDDLFESLSVPQQQAVARGDLSLEALLDYIKGATGAELCPRCAVRPIAARSNGLCSVCHKHALTEATDAVYAELVASREHAAARQRLKRKREELGVEAPKAPRTTREPASGDSVDSV